MLLSVCVGDAGGVHGVVTDLFDGGGIGNVYGVGMVLLILLLILLTLVIFVNSGDCVVGTVDVGVDHVVHCGVVSGDVNCCAGVACSYGLTYI